MRDYQRASDLPIDFDISSANNWEEVIETAKNAEEKYFADAGRIRKSMRWFGDHEASFKPWATLLPTDSYMSAISGSVKVLLAVCDSNE